MPDRSEVGAAGGVFGFGIAFVSFENSGLRHPCSHRLPWSIPAAADLAVPNLLFRKGGGGLKHDSL